MGSVSTRLIRGSNVPVLVVPPADVTDEVWTGGPPQPDEHPWVRILNDFTQANAGRRTTLFIDDPEVIIQGATLFRIVSYTVLFFGIIMVVFSAFQGAGKTAGFGRLLRSSCIGEGGFQAQTHRP